MLQYRVILMIICKISYSAECYNSILMLITLNYEPLSNVQRAGDPAVRDHVPDAAQLEGRHVRPPRCA